MKKKTRKTSSASSSKKTLGALGELRRSVARIVERAAERAHAGEDSAIELLTKQHDEVKALFKEIEGASTRARKLELFEELAANLVAHDAIERSIFYPACEREMGMTDLLGEALVEHGVVEFGLYQADEARQSDDFAYKFQVLSELVLHHVKEEENDFFPKVQKALGKPKLLELGAEMKASFEKAKAGDFRAPLRRNLKQVLAGALKPSAPPSAIRKSKSTERATSRASARPARKVKRRRAA